MDRAEKIIIKGKPEGEDHYSYHCPLTIESKRIDRKLWVSGDNMRYMPFDRAWLPDKSDKYEVSIWMPFMNYFGGREIVLVKKSK